MQLSLHSCLSVRKTVSTVHCKCHLLSVSSSWLRAMATSIPPHTWKNGFRQITKPVEPTDINPTDANRPYVNPAPQELPTSNVDNSHGKNFLRTWPSLYNGTEAPNGRPDWWKPSSEVDVLIIGAGPTGLETALSLSRQDVSFRILGKTPGEILVSS